MGGYGRDAMGRFDFRFLILISVCIGFLETNGNCSFPEQGGYGSVGRMGMGSSYTGGYGTPDGLGGYGKVLLCLILRYWF